LSEWPLFVGIARRTVSLSRMNGGCLCDFLHVPHISTTASSKNTNMRKPSADFRQLKSKFTRIAVIQFLCFVEFCMAAPRRICDDTFYPFHPWAVGKGRIKMVGVSAVDHEVWGISVSCVINFSDRCFQSGPCWKLPISFHRKCDYNRQPKFTCCSDYGSDPTNRRRAFG
jgi:hypothetical protein